MYVCEYNCIYIKVEGLASSLYLLRLSEGIFAEIEIKTTQKIA